jgi:hypothetical protein
MPRSFATRSTLGPLVIGTASRLNSFVKRRCLFPLTATSSIVHRGWLSTFVGQVHEEPDGQSREHDRILPFETRMGYLRESFSPALAISARQGLNPARPISNAKRLMAGRS